VTLDLQGYRRGSLNEVKPARLPESFRHNLTPAAK
jgi:hypothetical protein